MAIGLSGSSGISLTSPVSGNTLSEYTKRKKSIQDELGTGSDADVVGSPETAQYGSTSDVKTTDEVDSYESPVEYEPSVSTMEAAYEDTDSLNQEAVDTDWPESPGGGIDAWYKGGILTTPGETGVLTKEEYELDKYGYTDPDSMPTANVEGSGGWVWYEKGGYWEPNWYMYLAGTDTMEKIAGTDTMEKTSSWQSTTPTTSSDSTSSLSTSIVNPDAKVVDDKKKITLRNAYGVQNNTSAGTGGAGGKSVLSQYGIEY